MPKRDYITKGADIGIRADGRGRQDIRSIQLETGMITQASGSARIKIAGGTDVLVGVKVEVGSIDPDIDSEEAEREEEGVDDAELTGRDRDRGRAVCTVDWLVSPIMRCVLRVI